MKRVPFKNPSITTFLWVFLLSILTILSGGIIYILLRPSEPVFFSWIKFVGLEDFIFNTREKTLLFGQFLPEWFIYSLPNGLWAFSYSFIITVVWWKSKSRLKFFWIASIPILVFGFELFQYLEILMGTFCIGDIVFGVLGILAGNALGIKTNKINSYEKDMV
jgi:hypothetical protein